MTNTSNILVLFYISTVDMSLLNKKQPHKSTTLSVKNFMMVGALILSIVIISDEKQLKLFNMKKEGGGIVGNGCFFIFLLDIIFICLLESFMWDWKTSLN